MPAAVPTPRRADLLAAIVDDLLDNGVADLSLRPLAERVGTSARMLIHHFGSREALLAEAVAAVRAKVAATLSGLAQAQRPETLADVLMMFWTWATQPANQRHFRLLFELDGLGMYGRLKVGAAGADNGAALWLGLIERAGILRADDRDHDAGRSTLIMGALNGLLQDYLSTGDLARTTQALTWLLERAVAPPIPAASQVEA